MATVLPNVSLMVRALRLLGHFVFVWYRCDGRNMEIVSLPLWLRETMKRKISAIDWRGGTICKFRTEREYLKRKIAYLAMPLAYFFLLNHRFIECFQCNSLHMRSVMFLLLCGVLDWVVMFMGSFLLFFSFFCGNCCSWSSRGVETNSEAFRNVNVFRTSSWVL